MAQTFKKSMILYIIWSEKNILMLKGIFFKLNLKFMDKKIKSQM